MAILCSITNNNDLHTGSIVECMANAPAEVRWQLRCVGGSDEHLVGWLGNNSTCQGDYAIIDLDD